LAATEHLILLALVLQHNERLAESCLIRLRALVNSGTASRQYLSVSQNSPLAVDGVQRPAEQATERESEPVHLLGLVVEHPHDH
jgi:hypothetical protein